MRRLIICYVGGSDIVNIFQIYTPCQYHVIFCTNCLPDGAGGPSFWYALSLAIVDDDDCTRLTADVVDDTFVFI